MSLDTAAARHMVAAFKVLFEGNSSTDLRRFPSGGGVFATGVPDPFGNFAVGLSDDELPEALALLADKDAVAMTLRPGDADPAHEACCETYGFANVGRIPAMSADLDEVPDVPVPEGYGLERLEDPADGAEAWAHTLSVGYPLHRRTAEFMSPLLAVCPRGPEAGIQYFRAVAGSEVAAVSVLILSDGLAGIYSVATREEHRRRGLGAAVTARPLRIAREMGYRTGVLQASPDGIGVYRRLGFKDDGGVQLYMRQPSDA